MPRMRWHRRSATVMRPTGESSGSLSTPFRVINRSRLDIEVLFRYTIWETR